MSDDTTAQATERFDIPFAGRNQQNSYPTYEAGMQRIATLLFSLMESSKIIIKARPTVLIEEDGGSWYFKQDSAAQIISRTLQTTVTIQDVDLELEVNSLIGVTLTSGATAAQTVDWTLYQSNVPVDPEVIILGYVNEDYSITWFNGLTMQINRSMPWLETDALVSKIFDEIIDTGSISATGGTFTEEIEVGESVDKGNVQAVQMSVSAGESTNADIEFYDADPAGVGELIYLVEAFDFTDDLDDRNIWFMELQAVNSLWLKITNNAGTVVTFDVRVRVQGD